MKGLEPPRLSAPDPKSGTATNYATSASIFSKDILFKIGVAKVEKYCEKKNNYLVKAKYVYVKFILYWHFTR